MTPQKEQTKRRQAHPAPAHDRILRMAEMEKISGLNRWTITRAADRGELQLIKMTPRTIGARESVFWRWIDSKAI